MLRTLCVSVAALLAACASKPIDLKLPTLAVPVRYSSIPFGEIRPAEVEAIEFRDREFVEGVLKGADEVSALIELLVRSESAGEDSRRSFRAIDIRLKDGRVVRVSLLKGSLVSGGRRYEVSSESYAKIQSHFEK